MNKNIINYNYFVESQSLHLPTSSISLYFFNLTVPIHKRLGGNPCISIIFSVSVQNGSAVNVNLYIEKVT